MTDEQKVLIGLTLLVFFGSLLAATIAVRSVVNTPLTTPAPAKPCGCADRDDDPDDAPAPPVIPDRQEREAA